MKNLLIPSRHIIYSNGQYNSLINHLKNNTYENIVFAITSSNLNNCKYSSLDILYRINMVDSLINSLKKEFDFKHKIVCIPHFYKTDDFASNIIKYVNYNTELDLNNDNTHVFSYGKYLGEVFIKNGYSVTIEIQVDHIKLFEKLYKEKDENYFWENISIPSKYVFENQDEIINKTEKIWLDPILKETGSITETRNYHTYAYDMSNEEVINFKYNDIKPYIVEGKIVDEGCADAALFIPISRDFPDSDLIGVEITSDFIARANERIREGFFGGSFVNIVQANLLNKIFEDNFVDTVICNSTLHEVWSYNNKRESLNNYLKLKYNQLRSGGRLIARDVVGPGEPNKIVYMRDNTNNNELFKKFMNDFKQVRDIDTYEEVEINGEKFIKSNLKIISEYLLHKDYEDNWQSEMNEEFCHLNTSSWQKVLEENNFKIVKLNAYKNKWIEENRLKDKIILLDENKQSIDFPNTNIVIVAER